MDMPRELQDYFTPQMQAGALFLLFWFICIGLTGGLAGRKHRDDGLWAGYAIFTGAGALLLVIVVPPRKQGSDDPLRGLTQVDAAPTWEVDAFVPLTRPQRRLSALLGAVFGGVAGALMVAVESSRLLAASLTEVPPPAPLGAVAVVGAIAGAV